MSFGEQMQMYLVKLLDKVYACLVLVATAKKYFVILNHLKFVFIGKKNIEKLAISYEST